MQYESVRERDLPIVQAGLARIPRDRSSSTGAMMDGFDQQREGGGRIGQERVDSAVQESEKEISMSLYRAALKELSLNSKSVITKLTVLAGEHRQASEGIARVICDHISQVDKDMKLFGFYLLDSIVKNVGGDYVEHFSWQLFEVFSRAYRQVEAKAQGPLKHLLKTWYNVFPVPLLQRIELQLQIVTTSRTSSALLCESPRKLSFKRAGSNPRLQYAMANARAAATTTESTITLAVNAKFKQSSGRTSSSSSNDADSLRARPSSKQRRNIGPQLYDLLTKLPRFEETLSSSSRSTADKDAKFVAVVSSLVSQGLISAATASAALRFSAQEHETEAGVKAGFKVS